MSEAALTSQIMTIVVSMGMSAIGTVLVIKANMAWHKEKLERHSVSLKNAFQEIADLRHDAVMKHEEQQRDIHRLEVEIYRKLGERK